MTIPTVFDRVANILAQEYAVPSGEDDVTPATRFVSDLQLDSLDIAELIMFVEDEFGVEIPTEDADKCATVGDVVTLIEKFPLRR